MISFSPFSEAASIHLAEDETYSAESAGRTIMGKVYFRGY